MKVWVATSDGEVLDLLNAAMRMRWPNSGQLIVPGALEHDIAKGAKGCDLAVVDSTMDNLDACAIVTSIRHDADVPILVLSDPKGDQTVTARALVMGADDYLFKPVEIIEMIFRLETVAKVRLAKQL